MVFFFFQEPEKVIVRFVCKIKLFRGRDEPLSFSGVSGTLASLWEEGRVSIHGL